MGALEKRDVETELEETISRFHREQQGHQPEICKATLLPNMAVILSGGIFTRTEKDLSATEEGRKLIQSARREQRALTRRDAESRVGRLLGRSVPRSFYDLDVRTGEQVEVYILD